MRRPRANLLKKLQLRALPLFLAAALFLSGCEKPLKQYEASFLGLFDTVTVMTGYAENKDAFNSTATNQIYAELQKYHRFYDIYHDYEGVNNLKTLNDNAGGDPVKVEQPIIDLLLFCKEIYKETGGRVDAAMGSVLTLWHDAREEGIDDPENAKLPDPTALAEAAKHRGMDKVIIDEANSTVQITDPEVRLDVGAIAKGYAVEQVCRKSPGWLLLSVGGNVCPAGTKPDGSPWTVGIRDPEAADKYLRTVLVRKHAVVNSGDYERYYTVDGKQYHHIIDPATLYPAKYWKMVTILCPNSGVADALSTALFCMDREQGQALLEKYDAEAMWVTHDGEVLYSPGFEAFLKK